MTCRSCVGERLSLKSKAQESKSQCRNQHSQGEVAPRRERRDEVRDLKWSWREGGKVGWMRVAPVRDRDTSRLVEQMPHIGHGPLGRFSASSAVRAGLHARC